MKTKLTSVCRMVRPVAHFGGDRDKCEAEIFGMTGTGKSVETEFRPSW